MRVHVSSHAYYEKYLPAGGKLRRRQLAAKIQRHLFAKLRQGAKLRKGAVEVDISREFKAVVVPELEGGWEAVTMVCKRRRANNEQTVS